MREFHLMEVKTPEESKAPWDYFKLIRTISAEETAIALKDSECPMVKR
jgi:branched-chain amino acid transport system substrate-binding protein